MQTFTHSYADKWREDMRNAIVARGDGLRTHFQWVTRYQYNRKKQALVALGGVAENMRDEA